MRDWQLTAGRPLAMRFAADVRLSHTNYSDDQSWEVAFGSPQEPAISLQTRYGGRVGLARIVPMWVFENSTLYETQGFAEPPILRVFAPDFARITARLTPTLSLIYELWVMDSHAVGVRLTMSNEADSPATFSLDLIPQVEREGKAITMKVMGLSDGSEALHLGAVGNVNPVLLLEKSSGSREAQTLNPKLIVGVSIPPKSRQTVRFVHAALHSINESVRTAHEWLYETDWDGAFNLIEKVAHTPIVETGDADWDAALAFAAQVTLRSYIGPTGKLPFPSFVSARIPARGFSSQPDGSDQPFDWAGQSAQDVYLTAPTAAILAPDLARGAIRNALAVRQSDGWIDWKPGLGGQRSHLLAMPILASAAWAVYEITEDKHFLSEVYAGLHSFFMRWFAHDMDRDGDGVPEWANALQSGHEESATFNRFRRWSANADISKAETPELVALLIREGRSLLQMDEVLGGKSGTTASIQARLDVLQNALNTQWDDARHGYSPLDRDTHRPAKGTQIFRGRGDEGYSDKTVIDPPNRLVLRTIGGKEHAPRVTVVIEGINAEGTAINETIPASAFVWYYGLGTCVTEQVYSRVNYVRFEGLSRVYNVEIDTLDLESYAGLPALLPLWSGAEADHLPTLAETVIDPTRFLQPAGLQMSANGAITAKDDPNNRVVMFWNVLIAEGLIEHDYSRAASLLVRRLLDTQVQSLIRHRAFRSAYDAQSGDGIGDPDDLGGVLPLSLFFKFIGVRIVSARRVWAGGVFALEMPVTITHLGIVIKRSADGTIVRFPSGYETTVGADWQLIEDRTVEPEPLAPAPPPEPAALERVIPVEAQRDPTMEVSITGIDFTPQPEDKPDEPPPLTYKIPVRGPKKGE